MTSLFARNERLLWRTRFSTTEMPSQFLTQYNTIKSWQFSLSSLKLSLQSTHVHVVPRAVCRLREVSRLHGTYIHDCTYFFWQARCKLSLLCHNLRMKCETGMVVFLPGNWWGYWWPWFTGLWDHFRFSSPSWTPAYNYYSIVCPMTACIQHKSV